MTKTKSFIRAHTCFNRLDVPQFKNKKDLEENIQGILNQERFYFDFEWVNYYKLQLRFL